MRLPSPMRWAWRLALALPAVLVLQGCGAEPADDAASPGPASWTVSAEPELTIGVTEGDPGYMFQMISDARLLPDGRIVVADRGLVVLRAYGADGMLQAEMGGEGQGPGEFAFLVGMTTADPDTIFTWDFQAARITIHRADGELVGTRRIDGGDRRPDGFVGRFADGRLALSWIEPTERSPDEVTPDSMRLARFDPDGGLDTVLAEATGLRRFGTGPVPFSPQLHAVARGDRLYYTNGLAPEVHVLDAEGNAVATLATPEAGVDPDEARAALVAALEERGNQDLLGRLEDVPPADSVPHLAALLVDDAGRAWVKRYEPGVDALWLGGWAGGRGGEWWVLDPAEGHVATASLPDGLIPLDVRGDRLLGMWRDELGVERLAVHRIER